MSCCRQCKPPSQQSSSDLQWDFKPQYWQEPLCSLYPLRQLLHFCSPDLQTFPATGVPPVHVHGPRWRSRHRTDPGSAQ